MNQERIPEPNIIVPKLKRGTKILIETKHNVWSLELFKPKISLVLIESTEARFRGGLPLRAVFRGSRPQTTLEIVEGYLVRGWSFHLKFLDIEVVSFPVISAKVIGGDWEYEAIPRIDT